ncbi:MAG: ABC transporter permease subunit [Dorea sp.]|nr:ABC transporter permease subunit [Dorea sp.]
MRLLSLEMKRILRTRITWILLGMALVLTVAMAYIPVTFEGVMIEEQGEEKELGGLEAIRYYRQFNDTIYGEVTTEKLRDAIEKRQKLYQEYDSEYGENIPSKVYYEELALSEGYVHLIKEVFADSDNGLAPLVSDINPEEIDGFYDRLTGRLSSIMQMEQKNYPSAEDVAQKKFEKVRRPYLYYYGASSNSMDYQVLLIFIITVLCVVIAAPVFSAEYQTGADDILRCTRHGGIRLAVVKILSASLITSMAFALCGVLYVLITNSLFGWEGTKTSIQIIYSATCFPAYNMGQLQWVNLAGSFFVFLAAVSFTLFLSAKMKNNVSALAAGLLFVILPVLLDAALPGQIGQWLGCVLPAGGVGLSNCLLYSMIDYHFLHVGQASIWNVDMLLVIRMIEIPVFAALAVYAYCQRGNTGK